MIDTSKVAGRRTLHFKSLDDIAAEVERLARAREIKTLGNWTPGQIFRHLAIVMNGAIDGMKMKLPLSMRIIMPIMRLLWKQKFLSDPMPAGYMITGDSARHLLPPPTSLEDGLAEIRRGLQRLKTETKREPSPFMGHLSNEQWTQLQCRHCEMHLSFLLPID